MIQLLDPQGRTFDYLRLSITDACNYRCQYCLPHGYVKDAQRDSFLSPDEIENLVLGFVRLGIWKIRLTGGEPTVRKDFTEIAARVSSLTGIRHVAMTTNGYQLAKNAKLWYGAGIRAVNVSVDSLIPERFAHITGRDELQKVLKGIKAAQDAGFDRIKINTILLRDLNDDEISHFIEWTQAEAISVRFIELMETGDNKPYFQRHHMRGDQVIQHLKASGWYEDIRPSGAGPATIFRHSNHKGSVGIIAPYSKDFCTTCNRLRVTSRGELKLCLFGNGVFPLRHLLQSPEQSAQLQDTILSVLQHKQPSHHLHFHQTGTTPHLAALGG